MSAAMRAFKAVAAAAVVLLAAPSVASACRTSVAPLRIGGELRAVVLVDVVAARDTGSVGWWTWEIDARVTKVISGQPDAEVYRFLHTTGSNGCSGEPPAGQWVLYVATSAERGAVTEALPLELALRSGGNVAAAVSAPQLALLEPMDEAQFWSIMDRTTIHEADTEAQAQALRSELEALSADEVAAFRQTFERQLRRAYTWDLWAVAYIAHGGASDDGFEYFRRWMVSKGRGTFEHLLDRPDDLADLLAGDSDGPLEFEEIVYVIDEVWEEKSAGSPMDASPDELGEWLGGPNRPAGEPFSEDPEVLAARYPKTWARFGDHPLG